MLGTQIGVLGHNLPLNDEAACHLPACCATALEHLRRDHPAASRTAIQVSQLDCLDTLLSLITIGQQLQIGN
jgi:hypothetical protein